MKTVFWLRTKKQACLGASLLFLCAFGQELHAGVITGSAILDHGGWDFSEQISTTGPFEGDMFVAIVVDPPLGWRIAAAMPPALIAEIQDSTFQELTFAPEDTSTYSFDAPASVGRVYVVRTAERHYAKFRFLECDYAGLEIEYVYQPDGTRKLYDEISVEDDTWGGIKALFK